jgi:cell wall-associated NlpC family hydrolase
MGLALTIEEARSVTDPERPTGIVACLGARVLTCASVLLGAVLALSCLVVPGVAAADSGAGWAVASPAAQRASAAASVVTTGGLTGIVSAAAGGPLSGVSVSVSAGPRTTTNATGSYSIAGIGEGTRTVTFSKTGYLSKSPSIVVSAGATITLNVVLAAVPTTGTVRGVVTVAGGGPLSGVRVSVSGGTAATTASDGSYSVGDLKPGTHTLTFAKTGFVSGSRSAVISVGATATINAALIQDGDLVGTVIGSEGTSLPAVKVTLSAPGSHIVSYARTWLGVRYVWGGTSRKGVDCSGLTQAVAFEAGYPSFPRTAASQWAYFQSLGWTVAKPRSGDFVYFSSPSSPSGHHTAIFVSSGTILEAPGAGGHVKIAKMPRLHVLGYGRLQGGPTTTSAADGSYSIPRLEPGTYSVTLSTTGYVSASPATVIVSAKTATLRAALVADGNLSGSVTATSGVALAGATVSIKGLRSTSTAADGSYSIPLLAPGKYAVVFAKSGYVSQSGTTVIVSAKTAMLTAALVADGNLSGSVTATGSVPVAGVSVSIKGVRSTSTAADGSYSIPLLAPGTYSVAFAKAGYVSSSKRVVIAAGVTTIASIALARPVPTAVRFAGPAAIKVKKTLKLVGTVSPSAASGTVTISKKRFVSGKWRSAGSVKLRVSGGRFGYSFKPTARGTWRFIATYAGAVVRATTYLSSKSVGTFVKVR